MMVILRQISWQTTSSFIRPVSTAGFAIGGMLALI
jgi:hypothetical protein